MTKEQKINKFPSPIPPSQRVLNNCTNWAFPYIPVLQSLEKLDSEMRCHLQKELAFVRSFESELHHKIL